MKNKLLVKLIIFIIIAIILSIVLLSRNYIDSENLQGETLPKLAVNTSTWDTNKVTLYTDSNGEVVPVPKGYVVSSVSGENVVKTGLVIYEGTASVTSAPTTGSSITSSAQATRNQWVWVPVSDINRVCGETDGQKYGKVYEWSTTGRSLITGREPKVNTDNNEYYLSVYNFQSGSKHNFYQKLQVEYEDTIKSIQKYGGFYIGRYETGNLSAKIPVVRKMNTDINNQSWYSMFEKAKYLASNANVKTSMIYGSLWDETIQWFIDTESKTNLTVGETTNKTANWGNYYKSSFTYTNTSGSSVTKSANSAVRIPAGSSTYTKANNIYDMAGNVLDWTIETIDPCYRIVRGGCYNSTWNDRNVGSRDFFTPTIIVPEQGYRAYLYIR